MAVAASVRIPQTLHLLIWFDRDTGTYQGLVRELSIHAEGSTPTAVAKELERRSDTYVQDAIAEPNVHQLLPRPVPTREWVILSLQLLVRRAISRLHPRSRSEYPVSQRFIVPCGV